MGTSKKTPGRPKIVPVGSKAAQKGNSTQTPKKPRSTARYVEVKIRITREDFIQGLPYFGEEKRLGRFVLEAYKEKVKRSAANDKTARLRTPMGNIEILEPILKEMYAQGKLEFLYGNRRNDGGENGKAGKT